MPPRGSRVAAPLAAILVLALTYAAALASSPPVEVVTPVAAATRFAAENHARTAGAPTTRIEWLVLPFYAPTGHMSLRIGETAYSFGPRGWDVEPAAAYLTANRHFRAQTQRNAGKGIDLPALTYGASMEVPSDVAAELEQNILDDQAAGTKYSLLTNNCQTALLRLFPRRDGVSLGRAVGMVARLSPRHLLGRLRERAPYPVDATVHLYPVVEGGDARVPAEITRPTSTPRELVRIARSTPAMLQNEWLRRELKSVIRGAIRMPVGRPETRRGR